MNPFMKHNKKRMSQIMLALLSSAIITTECVGETSVDDQDQNMLISALNNRAGFSECTVESGLSILRPTSNDDFQEQILYLSTVGKDGYEYASLTGDGLRPLSYTYNVKGLGNELSGTLSITLTNSEEIYLYTKDVIGIPEIIESCTFEDSAALSVLNSELKYGPWSDYLISGVTFKARTVRTDGYVNHIGYQVGKAEDGRNAPSTFREYGFESGNKNTVIYGISDKALQKKVSDDWKI